MNVNEAVRKTLNGVLIDVEIVPGADKKGLFFDGWRKRIKVKVKGRASSGKTLGFSKDLTEKSLTFPKMLGKLQSYGICEANSEDARKSAKHFSVASSFPSHARKMPLAFSVALKDEANDEMLGFFSKLFDRKVKIFSGERSRKKHCLLKTLTLMMLLGR